MSVPFKRRFGFELEFLRDSTNRTKLVRAIRTVAGEVAESCEYGHQNNNSEWVAKTDASCGFEVASRVMSSATDLRKGVEVVQAISRSGARVDQRCGFHVHVEIADFDEAKLADMVQWWVKFERFITDVLSPTRKNNVYCRQVGREFRGNQQYDTNTTLRSNFGRNALNSSLADFATTAASGRRRVEFRIAQGTNDFVDVKNWVRFLLTFVEFARTAGRPENVNYLLPKEIFDKLGLLNSNISSGLTEMRTWLLDSALKNAEDDLDRKLIKHLQSQLCDD